MIIWWHENVTGQHYLSTPWSATKKSFFDFQESERKKSSWNQWCRGSLSVDNKRSHPRHGGPLSNSLLYDIAAIHLYMIIFCHANDLLSQYTLISYQQFIFKKVKEKYWYQSCRGILLVDNKEVSLVWPLPNSFSHQSRLTKADNSHFATERSPHISLYSL